VKRKVITDLQNEMDEKCGTETTEVGCNAVGGARIEPCIWDPTPEPPALQCQLNPTFQVLISPFCSQIPWIYIHTKKWFCIMKCIKIDRRPVRLTGGCDGR